MIPNDLNKSFQQRRAELLKSRLIKNICPNCKSINNPPNAKYCLECKTPLGVKPAKQNKPHLSPKSHIIDNIITNMVLVEGGSFMMGAIPEKGAAVSAWKKNIHRVNLSSFSICRYEVTQEEWETVMGFNPSFFKGGKHPVENISWNDCQEFITRLNNMTGKRFRLPTEAEWEFAARGGIKSHGYKYAGSTIPDRVAWYINNSDNETHIVGHKAPNELDLYDMSGNVLEWCQDWFGNYGAGTQTNPKGPIAGTHRVARGGSWMISDWMCSVTSRGLIPPNEQHNNLGLRLAL